MTYLNLTTSHNIFTMKANIYLMVIHGSLFLTLVLKCGNCIWNSFVVMLVQMISRIMEEVLHMLTVCGSSTSQLLKSLIYLACWQNLQQINPNSDWSLQSNSLYHYKDQQIWQICCNLCCWKYINFIALYIDTGFKTPYHLTSSTHLSLSSSSSLIGSIVIPVIQGNWALWY